jgi:hypothetical protein
MCRFMRTIVFMVLLVGTVWVADQVAFDGRYSRAAWIEAKTPRSAFSARD